ncbi:MAG: DUF1275 domain-containing protein [Paraburkholderia sp.]|nr:MAG: DUF1275 domain-containing protein [Paraburkholderia sp.]
MSLQDTMITRLSCAEIRITRVTGIVTAIGIEPGKLCDLNSAKTGRGAPFVLANRARLKVHGTMLAMFVVDGLTGAMGFRHVDYACVHGRSGERTGRPSFVMGIVKS